MTAFGKATASENRVSAGAVVGALTTQTDHRILYFLNRIAGAKPHRVSVSVCLYPVRNLYSLTKAKGNGTQRAGFTPKAEEQTTRANPTHMDRAGNVDGAQSSFGKQKQNKKMNGQRRKGVWSMWIFFFFSKEI